MLKEKRLLCITLMLSALSFPAQSQEIEHFMAMTEKYSGKLFGPFEDDQKKIKIIKQVIRLKSDCSIEVTHSEVWGKGIPDIPSKVQGSLMKTKLTFDEKISNQLVIEGPANSFALQNDSVARNKTIQRDRITIYVPSTWRKEIAEALTGTINACNKPQGSQAKQATGDTPKIDRIAAIKEFDSLSGADTQFDFELNAEVKRENTQLFKIDPDCTFKFKYINYGGSGRSRFEDIGHLKNMSVSITDRYITLTDKNDKASISRTASTSWADKPGLDNKSGESKRTFFYNNETRLKQIAIPLRKIVESCAAYS